MKLLSVRNLLLVNILLGGLAVILGAIGSHLLGENIETSNVNKFEIAQRYHMFHVLVVLIQVAMIGNGVREVFLKISMVLMLLGVLCFCGSLYLGFFLRVGFFDFLAPIGGFFFLIGWVTFFLSVVTRKKIV